jgi:hypothetical protein
MRRFLLSLLALCFLALPAAPGAVTLAEQVSSASELGKLDRVAIGSFNGTGGNLTGFWQTTIGGGEPVQASITFLQCANLTTNVSSYTFTAQNTGTATADRVTLVGVVVEDALGQFSISSVTVGGDTATILNQQGAGVSASVSSVAGFAALSNTAGTSEDIVVTTSEAATAATACVWQVNDIDFGAGGAGFYFTGGETFGNALMTRELKVPARGVAAGLSMVDTTAATNTWTGLVESSDGSNGEFEHSTAEYTEDATPSSPLSVSTDWSAGTIYSTFAAISFYPSDWTPGYFNFLQCYSNSAAATTYNFTSANVGPENGTRHTIVSIAANDAATAFGVSSASVGGDAATEVIDEDGTSVASNTAIYIVANDVGTSETVSVTFTEAILQATVCIYAVYGIDSATPNASVQNSSTTAAAINLNLSTQVDGFVVTAGASLQGGATMDWTGVVDDGEVTHTVGGSSQHFGASAETTVSETRTVTCDGTGGGQVSCVSASW